MKTYLTKSQKNVLFAAYQMSEGSSERIWDEDLRDKASELRDKRDDEGKLQVIGIGTYGGILRRLESKGLLGRSWQPKDLEKPNEGRPRTFVELTNLGVEVTPVAFIQSAETSEQLATALSSELGQLVMTRLGVQPDSNSVA